MTPLSAIDSPRVFYEQAAFQLVCAKCRRAGDHWEAHHVVSAQTCRIEGAPRHSPDNALRLCAKAPDACHERHTSAQERVPLACLLDENIAFAARWLGSEYAYVYLRANYSGEDPRVDALVYGEPLLGEWPRE